MDDIRLAHVEERVLQTPVECPEVPRQLQESGKELWMSCPRAQTPDTGLAEGRVERDQAILCDYHPIDASALRNGDAQS
jgi:hypothetical protein